MTGVVNRRDFIRQSACCAAVLSILNLLDTSCSGPRSDDDGTEQDGELFWVEAEGSPAEIGRQYAEKLGDAFRIFIDDSAEQLRERFDARQLEKAVNFMIKILDHDFPYLVKEMQGMAEGADLDFRDVALVNLSAGLMAYILPKNSDSSSFGCPAGQGFGEETDQDGCTNIIFPHSDLGPIMGKTLDGSSPVVGQGVVRLMRPEKGYASLFYSTLNGISTEQGINEKGLGVGVSSLHFPTINLRGIIRNFLPRLLLQECANVKEGIQFLSRYPVLRHGFHYTLADREGHAAVVERSPTEMYVRRSDDDPIFCTNHTATPCMRKLELSRGPVGDKNSDERYANLVRITSSPDFEMNFENMKSILKNHRVPGGICQHGDLEMYTRRTYMVVVNEGKLFVTSGPACRHEFKEFSLTGLG